MTDPWAPPPYSGADDPVRRRRFVVVAVVSAFGLLLAGFAMAAVVRVVREDAAKERADRELAAAADRATDRALARPADTERVSPGPDGSRRFDSAPAFDGAHAFHLTIPRGWEGRHVGVRDSRASILDSVLTRPGFDTVVVVARIEPPHPVGTAPFLDGLRDAVDRGEQPIRLTSELVPATVGDNDAFRVDGELRPRLGRAKSVRIVVFEHGGESFRVDFLTPTEFVETTLPDFQRILARWEFA